MKVQVTEVFDEYSFKGKDKRAVTSIDLWLLTSFQHTRINLSFLGELSFLIKSVKIVIYFSWKLKRSAAVDRAE